MTSLCDQGYEIHVGHEEIRCANRHTWALGYFSGVLGSLAGLAAVIGVLALIGVVGLPETALIGMLLGIAVVLGIVILFLQRILRSRRGRPLEEIRDVVLISFHDGLLRDGDGAILAESRDIAVSMHLDMWTRGLMRVVRLHWPSGSAVVLRSIRPARARQARDLLKDLIGKRS